MVAAKIAPRDAAREYIACAHAHGRAHFADLDGLEEYVAAVQKIFDAVDDSSFALFAGLKAEPVPSDAPAAAFHQAMVLRELRGGAHLTAIAAVGLPSVTAHAIKRPNDVATFGWAEGEVDEPTADDIAKRDRAEAMTNEILEPRSLYSPTIRPQRSSPELMQCTRHSTALASRSVVRPSGANDNPTSHCRIDRLSRSGVERNAIIAKCD